MPNNLRFSNPDTIAKPPGYSHVVEVTGPGRIVYFAGQLGMDRSGKMGAKGRAVIHEHLRKELAELIVEVGAGVVHGLMQALGEGRLGTRNIVGGEWFACDQHGVERAITLG